MSVELNHTIVYCRDKNASAGFLAEILGLPPPGSYGPFAVVEVSNGVQLDFLEGEVHSQHYAFLVSEAEFDEIHGRLVERDVPYWADPGHQRGTADQHQGRGAWPLLGRPRRPRPGDPHGALRRLADGLITSTRARLGGSAELTVEEPYGPVHRSVER